MGFTRRRGVSRDLELDSVIQAISLAFWLTHALNSGACRDVGVKLAAQRVRIVLY